MVDILVSPPEGCCGFVVLLDVADELSRQIGFGSEDSSSNDMALNFGKPDFDLIEPARIGRSVMNPNGTREYVVQGSQLIPLAQYRRETVESELWQEAVKRFARNRIRRVNGKFKYSPPLS